MRIKYGSRVLFLMFATVEYWKRRKVKGNKVGNTERGGPWNNLKR